jgi:hypothetical protein
MKKLLITTAATLFTVAAFAQGSVYFSNTGLEKMSSGASGGPYTAVSAVSATVDYGLFYGIGESTSLTFLSTQIGVNSTSTAGVIANPTDSKSALTSVDIPGTSPGETDVYVQMAGWSASFGSAGYQAASTTPNAYFGASTIINVAPTSGGLGPTTGPGAIIWQLSSGTATTEMRPFELMLVPSVPEPTSMALAGLGLATLLIFRRRS